MTTSIASEVKRAKARPDASLRTFDEDLRLMMVAQTNTVTRVTFPSPKYRADPVAFFREILGVEPWSKQIEVIESIRDNKRVAVKSGHKVSKSHSAAGIALWFYCSFPDARVVMTSTTSRQVDDILWRECRMMRARSGICVECKKENEGLSLANQIKKPCVHSAEIDGEMGELARTGLKSEDFREIKGFTAREAEAVAGISGANLLYLLDEASGIKQEIFDAIEGNRAGGARIVMFSNPTRTTGEFYDAFNGKEKFYKTHTISSEDTPNVVHGDDDPRAIPGLASREWIEEKKEEWGEKSALYLVRVKGEFSELEDGKVFSIHIIGESEARWPTTPATGRLYIGLDPAGDGPSGDESVWITRRGKKLITVFAMRGLSKESLLAHTLGQCNTHKNPREIPVVMLDREGKVGAEVFGHFLAFVDSREDPPFELVGIRASDRARRNPLVYDRMRDELAANFLDWINDGGAILSDTKLQKEMHVLEWIEQINGRVKITPKKDIKKELGRSPDRYDAAVLVTWEPITMRDNKPPRKETIEVRLEENVPMDPYAASDQMLGS